MVEPLGLSEFSFLWTSTSVCSFSFCLLGLFPKCLPDPNMWVWLSCCNKTATRASFLTSDSQFFSSKVNHSPGKAQ